MDKVSEDLSQVTDSPERPVLDLSGTSKEDIGNIVHGVRENIQSVSYKLKQIDLDRIIEGAHKMVDSNLVDGETLRGLRIITFDSDYVYVCTNGEHASVLDCEVEQITSVDDYGFKVYKIKHTEELGRKNSDYKGGTALICTKEVFDTAVDKDTFVKAGGYETPKTIFIPPSVKFNQLHKGKYDYDSDLIFHETAHVEEMSIYDWPNDREVPSFPSEEKINDFEGKVRSCKGIHRDVIDVVLGHLDRATTGEMYAITIERAAKNMYVPDKLVLHDKDIATDIASVAGFSKLSAKVLNSSHRKASILSLALEEVIPDFHERKQWLQSLLRT